MKSAPKYLPRAPTPPSLLASSSIISNTTALLQEIIISNDDNSKRSRASDKSDTSQRASGDETRAYDEATYGHKTKQEAVLVPSTGFYCVRETWAEDPFEITILEHAAEDKVKHVKFKESISSIPLSANSA